MGIIGVTIWVTGIIGLLTTVSRETWALSFGCRGYKVY